MRLPQFEVHPFFITMCIEITTPCPHKARALLAAHAGRRRLGRYNSNIFFSDFAVFPTVRATISSPSSSTVLPRGIVIKESRIR